MRWLSKLVVLLLLLVLAGTSQLVQGLTLLASSGTVRSTTDFTTKKNSWLVGSAS